MLSSAVDHSAATVAEELSDRLRLLHRLKSSRRLSQLLAAPLSDEDQVVQPMDDASPTKWHLAHTTWFYETFLLKPHLPGYREYSPDFAYCFNSYYESHGKRQARNRRGLLTRPSVDEVRGYRAHVDEALERMFVSGFINDGLDGLAAIVELGINHEQQHQELLLTDTLSLFDAQPLHPAYRTPAPCRDQTRHDGDAAFIEFPGGIFPVGFSGTGFCYDNEEPRHDALLQPFRLAHRCVTNAEWLAFMDDGGYRDPLLWLADGWSAINANGWDAPGYWHQRDGVWHQMTLEGLVPVNLAAPVAHVNYYEANAFANWAGKRLPTEFEWEIASTGIAAAGNDLGTGLMRPQPAADGADGELTQMFGDVWEWTSSAYLPYPGYRAAPGALGEYNGKFMVSQNVLRGGSCVTPPGHIRRTYRNFFYPHQRWQFSGVRLAEDAA
ncbi:hypothetical protein APY04_1251 [Hyphomicrobium sulfonivorans]|uniref:Ergothioneine biosynthesis protein EgtB n=1 Tax=Hyphomicrobium sulfonivorans TaxID=121290 RepID=A0A109BJM2_HYPSL|nr:ergothioneine biosynthesis protein EgtB [Hyphomicrobium sulfonivorans]KWT70042.1 hypothetical protein APY04_1251 [Hyphomicrobium sulfonivorans]